MIVQIQLKEEDRIELLAFIAVSVFSRDFIKIRLTETERLQLIHRWILNRFGRESISVVNNPAHQVYFEFSDPNEALVFKLKNG